MKNRLSGKKLNYQTIFRKILPSVVLTDIYAPSINVDYLLPGCLRNMMINVQKLTWLSVGTR
jgi:hypothetical protein